METQRTPPDRLHVLAARLKLWLLDLCVWLSEWMGRKLPRELRLMLREDIRKTLSGVRVVVLMLALSRCGAAPVCAHVARPGAPRGFRRTGVLDNDMRSICRKVRLRGRTIAAKLAELRNMFDTLDAWVARVRKRLMTTPHGARLVLCWMIADLCRDLALPVPLGADTS